LICQDSDQLVGYGSIGVRAERANCMHKFFFGWRVEKAQESGVGAEAVFAKAPYRGLADLVTG